MRSASLRASLRQQGTAIFQAIAARLEAVPFRKIVLKTGFFRSL
jgi:hypothetical protein